MSFFHPVVPVLSSPERGGAEDFKSSLQKASPVSVVGSESPVQEGLADLSLPPPTHRLCFPKLQFFDNPDDSSTTASMSDLEADEDSVSIDEIHFETSDPPIVEIEEEIFSVYAPVPKGELCVVCAEVRCVESLPCGHFTCDDCLEQYVAVGEQPNQRLSFQHLFCPQRCGCFIGTYYARDRSDEVKEKMRAAEQKMKLIQRLSLERLLIDQKGSLARHQAELLELEGDEGEIVYNIDQISVVIDEEKLVEARRQKSLAIKANAVMTQEEAMRVFSFYDCFRCKDVIFGGRARCEAAENPNAPMQTILCNKCCCVGGAERSCTLHGEDYIEFKCMFCCKPRTVTYKCHGVDFYCDTCHEDPGKLTKCDPNDCIFGGKHPFGFPANKKSERYSLGCTLCSAGAKVLPKVLPELKEKRSRVKLKALPRISEESSRFFDEFLRKQGFMQKIEAFVPLSVDPPLNHLAVAVEPDILRKDVVLRPPVDHFPPIAFPSFQFDGAVESDISAFSPSSAKVNPFQKLPPENPFSKDEKSSSSVAFQAGKIHNSFGAVHKEFDLNCCIDLPFSLKEIELSLKGSNSFPAALSSDQFASSSAFSIGKQKKSKQSKR